MKNLIKCVVFTCILSITLAITYKILSWKDTTGAYISATEQLYNTDDNLIDVVFLGSSHTYCGIYPAVLWNMYGIAAFDMAVSGQDRDSTVHYLKEVLKTQKPSVVCVDLYGLLFDRQEVIGNAYRNMLGMKTSKNSVELVKDYVDMEEWGDYILRWPIIHTRYRELDKYDFIENPLNEFCRGEYVTWEGYGGTLDPKVLECDEIADIAGKKLDWLNELLEMSRDNNFELVLFEAPMKLTDSNMRVLNAAKAFAGEHDIPFILFNELVDELEFNQGLDMTDDFHCNADGAVKVTSYFGEYLASNYDLPDHRGDIKYEIWNRDAEYLEHMIAAHKMNDIYAEDNYSYVQMLSECDNMTVIVSCNGDYFGAIPYLGELGIEEDDLLGGGKYLLENGTLRQILSGSDTASIELPMSKYDTFLIKNADGITDVLLNTNSEISVTDGINIIVYDNMLNKLVSKRGLVAFE